MWEREVAAIHRTLGALEGLGMGTPRAEVCSCRPAVAAAVGTLPSLTSSIAQQTFT